MVQFQWILFWVGVLHWGEYAGFLPRCGKRPADSLGLDALYWWAKIGDDESYPDLNTFLCLGVRPISLQLSQQRVVLMSQPCFSQ